MGNVLPAQTFLGFFSKDDLRIAFSEHMLDHFDNRENRNRKPFNQIEAEVVFEDFIDVFWNKMIKRFYK